MNIDSIQSFFNEYAVEKNMKYRIVENKTPKELKMDHTPDNIGSGVLTFDDNNAAIYYTKDGETISSIHLLSTPPSPKDTVDFYFLSCMLIDIFTGWSIARRNKLISRLGYNDGSLLSGTEVCTGGITAKAKGNMGRCSLTISKDE